MSGSGHTYIAEVDASGDAFIDGLLSGSAWDDDTITYSFPDSGAAYVDYGTSEPDGHLALTSTMKSIVRYALDRDDGNAANDGFALEGFTALTVDFVTSPGAHIRVAQTSEDPYGVETAWGGYPWWNPEAGDVWFHTEVYDYTSPKAGEHNFRTFLHEIGHSLGLKHGHADEATGYGTLPSGRDSFEYSLMTYRNHPGADLGASYGEGSAPQSFMMADIAALQFMYGADYTTNAGNTVYSWGPDSGETVVDGGVAIDPVANIIFATIWDGGGIDTYDLSAYATRVKIDLRPGKHSLFSSDQAADLGDDVSARGNIFNALLFEGDKRSLIEWAIGGSGNDLIKGNNGDNRLTGRAGNDKLVGLGGDDDLRGAAGKDKLIGGGGSDILTGGKGRDILKGGAGRDSFAFGKGDGTDKLRDFEDDIDTLLLDARLFGGKSLSKQKILNKFASLDGDDLVFDFGRKGTVIVQDFDDLAAIKDDFAIV